MFVSRAQRTKLFSQKAYINLNINTLQNTYIYIYRYRYRYRYRYIQWSSVQRAAFVIFVAQHELLRMFQLNNCSVLRDASGK